MKEKPQQGAKRGARATAPEAKPEIFLTRWRLIETERGDVHLLGHHAKEGGARVTAPVVSLDLDTRRAVTLRGRPYLLKGDSEFDLTAAYLLESWREVMKVSSCEDVTDQIVAGEVSSCQQQLSRAIGEVEHGGLGLTSTQKLTRAAARELLRGGNPEYSRRGQFFVSLCGIACLERTRSAGLVETYWADEWERMRYNPARWPTEEEVDRIRDFLREALSTRTGATNPPGTDNCSSDLER